MPRPRRSTVVRRSLKEDETDDDEDYDDSVAELSSTTGTGSGGKDEPPTPPLDKQKRKKRGRPPKQQQQQPLAAAAKRTHDDDDSSEESPPPPKKKRGRPRKTVPKEMNNNNNTTDDKAAPPPKTKKRGQSPVQQEVEEENTTDNESEGSNSEEEVEEMESSDGKMERESDESEDSETSEEQDSVFSGSSARSREDSSDNDDSNACPSPPRRKKRQKTARRKPSTCQYCHKTFGGVAACNYHVSHFVCRPHLRPGGPPLKGRRTNNNNNKRYKRHRGKLTDRTCPFCDKVFTSVLGCKYHVDKQVCVQQESSSNNNNNNTTLWPNLQPGTKFCTTFGIVQVVNDSRNSSTATSLPSSQQVKTYTASLNRYEKQVQKRFVSIAVESRVRRHYLHNLYKAGTHQDGTLVQTAVYQRASPMLPPPPTGPDHNPSAPPESHPDRMVECRLVTDQRPRYIGADESTIMTGQNTVPHTNHHTRLFLRRRLLTEPYNNNTPLYYCPKCWKAFTSKPGCKIHFQANTCGRKLERAQQQRESVAQRMESRVRARLAPAPVDQGRCLVVRHPPTLETVVLSEEEEETKNDSPNNNSGGATPADEMPNFPNPSGQFAGRRRAKKKKKAPKAKPPKIKLAELQSPHDTLRQIKDELYFLQGQTMPAMYESVWKSLRFKAWRPPKKKKSRTTSKQKAAIQAAAVSKKRPSRTAKKAPPVAVPAAAASAAKRPRAVKAPPPIAATALKPPPPKAVAAPKPPPSPTVQPTAIQPFPPLVSKDPPKLIDSRVLTKEVDFGRYPSMKRYTGCQRDKKCAICKSAESKQDKQELLLSCDYCRRSVHFTCMSTKFIVKYPEPEDDFMCHGCISVILSRRVRAEKRRLEKLSPELVAELESDELRTKLQLTKGVVVGQEFECVAAQGKQLVELSQLIKDARSRMMFELESTKVNQTRQELLSEFENGHS